MQSSMSKDQEFPEIEYCIFDMDGLLSACSYEDNRSFGVLLI